MLLVNESPAFSWLPCLLLTRHRTMPAGQAGAAGDKGGTGPTGGTGATGAGPTGPTGGPPYGQLYCHFVQQSAGACRACRKATFLHLQTYSDPNRGRNLAPYTRSLSADPPCLVAGSVCNDDSIIVHISSKTICVVYAAVAWVLKIPPFTLTGKHSCFQVAPATGGPAQRGTSPSAAL